tara:strand:- start:189 stop:707 length:519 start_codon:yes stop_codon:yes gene_type:complete
MVDRRLKKGEINEGMMKYLLKEVREKMKEVGWNNLSDDEKKYRKRIWDMYIEYGDRMERDELNEIRCNRLYLSYGMYGVDFRIMNCMDGIEGEKIIGGNGYDIIGLEEKENNENDLRDYEIENRLVWSFILGCCESLNVKRVWDSEGDGWVDFEEYKEWIVKYLNDDLENYY